MIHYALPMLIAFILPTTASAQTLIATVTAKSNGDILMRTTVPLEAGDGLKKSHEVRFDYKHRGVDVHDAVGLCPIDRTGIYPKLGPCPRYEANTDYIVGRFSISIWSILGMSFEENGNGYVEKQYYMERKQVTKANGWSFEYAGWCEEVGANPNRMWKCYRDRR